jgi:hypothetical protein
MREIGLRMLLVVSRSRPDSVAPARMEITALVDSNDVVVHRYSTITRSLAPRPNVSGMYISSALGGGTTKLPGVVARAMYS